MTARVYVMRGIPGSGKTTKAMEIARQTGSFRLNRDELRSMMFGHSGAGGGKRPSKMQEKAVIAARNAALRVLLDAGHQVILDDTNLRRDEDLRGQVREAYRPSAPASLMPDSQIEIVDCDADVDECIRRDLARPRSVGEQVIRTMAAKRDAVLGLVASPRYDPSLEMAVIVDIDGTLAHIAGRGPYQWDRVSEDTLDPTVADLVGLLAETDQIVLVSGRDEVCRDDTEAWLVDNNIAYSTLYMRPEGSTEDDRLVKERIYREHIEGWFNVRLVLDDRDKVVRMWRRLGLKVLQVAEGNF